MFSLPALAARGRPRTLLAALLALPLLVGLAACDEDCPDLALQAMEVTTSGVSDVSAIHVTATVTGTAQVAIDDGDLNLLSTLDGNTYDLVFTRDGTEIGSLDAVCTMGYMTGCTADKHTLAEMPQVVITEDGSGIAVTLGRTGQCPAD